MGSVPNQFTDMIILEVGHPLEKNSLRNIDQVLNDDLAAANKGAVLMAVHQPTLSAGFLNIPKSDRDNLSFPYTTQRQMKWSGVMVASFTQTQPASRKGGKRKKRLSKGKI